jgi:hypothetical protein
VSHGFSAQALYAFEPYVDSTIQTFRDQVDQLAARKTPFDIYFW